MGGMTQPGRKFAQTGSSYKYGFNGLEKSKEVAEGNLTAEFWEYDSKIGRRWNVDPIVKEFESPYAAFSCNPIYYSDPSGANSEGPGDTKDLATVTVYARSKPKEGKQRINPAYDSKNGIADIKSRISEIVNPIMGGIKPPEEPLNNGPYIQTYHRGSKYFDEGWYSSDEYELSTYDWDNGQVMASRDGWDIAAQHLGISEYSPPKGPFGGRNWNGFQVDDRGYLTGNSFSNPRLIEMGQNPLKALKNISRFLQVFSKLIYSASSRGKVLNKIQNNNVRNLVKSLYRQENMGKPLVGTGSAIDAFRWTAQTGQLIGGSNHAIKMLQTLKAANNIMRKQVLNNFDKRIIKELINDVTNALKGN